MLTAQRIRLSVAQAHIMNRLRDRTGSQWASSARDRVRRTLFEPSLRRAYERRAMQHHPYLPTISADMRAIVDAVEREGAHIGSLTSLNIPRTDEMLQLANTLLPKLTRDRATKPSSITVHADHTDFDEFPLLYLWGLNDKLLDLVENYLGVPVGYHGIEINRSIANGIEGSTRLWHADPQDHRMLRIIIYLNDVDNDDGPFEYIARQHSETARRSLRYSNEHIFDNIMRSVVPADLWNACVGPKETVIFADTANILHRGKAPKSRERVAIFYTYYSAKPMHERYLQPAFPRAFLDSIADGLNERQRASAFWRN